MTKQDFAEHFRGVLNACGDGYIRANLEDALKRYLAGQPARPPAPHRSKEPPHDNGWPAR